MFRRWKNFALLYAGVFVLIHFGAGNASAQVTGALFTTDSECAGVDLNIYSSKDAVYIDGGPTRKGAATGLPDGSYYVRVTTPDGKTVLGQTATAFVQVINGEFQGCYQLAGILVSPTTGQLGYDDTTNNGGEYKVWISRNPEFPNRESKTDNFKIVPSAGFDSDGDGILDEDEILGCIDNPDLDCGHPGSEVS
ncbi:MAG TPA: hypothetical protein VNO43_07390 [Candidatus Eisenbacteria bacterium]|nr:hypothetical protein [Candidatus Eisenbacteria bacterium]